MKFIVKSTSSCSGAGRGRAECSHGPHEYGAGTGEAKGRASENTGKHAAGRTGKMIIQQHVLHARYWIDLTHSPFTHVRPHARTPARPHACMHTHSLTRARTHAHTRHTHTHTHARMHACTCWLIVDNQIASTQANHVVVVFLKHNQEQKRTYLCARCEFLKQTCRPCLVIIKFCCLNRINKPCSFVLAVRARAVHAVFT